MVNPFWLAQLSALALEYLVKLGIRVYRIVLLLPYFPIQQLLNLENKINLTGLVEGQDFNIVGTENSKNTISVYITPKVIASN